MNNSDRFSLLNHSLKIYKGYINYSLKILTNTTQKGNSSSNDFEWTRSWDRGQSKPIGDLVELFPYLAFDVVVSKNFDTIINSRFFITPD